MFCSHNNLNHQIDQNLTKQIKTNIMDYNRAKVLVEVKDG